jgi:predicted nucleic acid-binding protein
MAVDAYPDSSFLFSVVTKDSHTPDASGYVVRAAVPLIFTPLHRIELRNALRNAAGRDEITAQECRAGFRLLDEDLAEACLIHVPIEGSAVLRRADELSEAHATKQGQRTIDLLHVASALESGAKTFLSFDRRQRRLAQAAGLKVKP